MTPEEIKFQIHAAYKQAISNPYVQTSHGSNLAYLFRDLKLYGQDAGTDFIETNLNSIVKEAVETAKCKSTMLELTAYGCGRAATEAMAEALRKATLMNVEVNGSVVRLIWADKSPRLL